MVYHSKRGDAGALLDIARTIATREKHTVMTIIAVVRDHTNRNRGLGHYIAEYGNDREFLPTLTPCFRGLCRGDQRAVRDCF